MRTITAQTIADAVADLCATAAADLPTEVVSALEKAKSTEESPLGRSIIDSCLRNAALASRERMAICQDTGFAVYLVEMGVDLHIEGGTIDEAINAGTARGWKNSFLRASIVSDPLYDRTNTGTNTPAVIHLSQVKGDALTISIAPKGGGSENVSAFTMLKPSDGENAVIDFVVNAVVRAGGNPCPPIIVGVGIGGSFEKCTQCAKRALFRTLGEPHPDPRYAELEQKILAKINASGVGPQGLGGTVTAFSVHVETFPCHIASLPVAVNVNCHAARHASITL